MKMKRYILPITLVLCSNTIIAEDYGWYHHPQAIVGPFASPEELCTSVGGEIKDMNPVSLITWGMSSAGRCDNPGGLGFFRLGDGCSGGKVYDQKQMSCEPDEPNKRPEMCSGATLDILGQCNPQANPGNVSGSGSEEEATCDGNGDAQGNPVLIATGQKVQVTTDLELRGSALNFSRNYWSSRLFGESIGLAWQHNWQMKIETLQSRGRIKLYRDNGRGIIFTPRNGRWESDSSDTEVITKLPGTQGWKVQTATGKTERYNNEGQLISYQKQGFPSVALSYNANKQLISLKDAKGQSLSLTYNAKNLISKVTTSNGSSISYSYDTQNRLISFTKDGNTQKYHYENSQYAQLLTGITDEQGVRYASWTYNDQGQAITSEHAGGADKYKFEYLPNNQTRVTNPLGKAALYTFQDIRLEKKIKKIEGEAINSCMATNQSFSYNASGLVVSKNTKNNTTISYEYNNRGLQTKRKFSGSALRYESTTKWHETLPLPLEFNNNGQRQSFKYDSEGRLIEYTNGFKDQSEVNKGQDVALLQFDDFNNQIGNNFVDEAGTLWSKVGNPQIVDDPDTATGKALYLDTNSYLSTSLNKFQFGKGDFTIEFRVKLKPRTANSKYGFLSIWNSNKPGSSLRIYSMNSSPVGVLVYHAFQSGDFGQVHGYPANLNVIDNDDWHHIAYVRKDNVLSVYYDGVKRTTIDDPITYQFDETTTTLDLGTTIDGYLDQVRISKEAIYTENFAPSDKRLELNNHVVENNQGKDVALLQFNDFTDQAGIKWAKIGNPQIVDDPEAIGGKALYVNTDSYLTTSAEKFQFGKGDFTIEFWEKLKPRTSNSKYGFLNMWNSNKADSSLRIYSMNSAPVGVLVYHAFQSGGTGQTHGYPAGLNVIDNNEWHHIAYVRKDNILTLYYDGISKLIIKDPIDYMFYPEVTKLNLGQTIDGYLNQVRISKRAIYTQDFTPSREPYVLNQGVTNP